MVSRGIRVYMCIRLLLAMSTFLSFPHPLLFSLFLSISVSSSFLHSFTHVHTYTLSFSLFLSLPLFVNRVSTNLLSSYYVSLCPAFFCFQILQNLQKKRTERRGRLSSDNMTKKKSGFSKSELIFKVTRPNEHASSRPFDSHRESTSTIFHPIFRDSTEGSRNSSNFRVFLFLLFLWRTLAA